MTIWLYLAATIFLTVAGQSMQKQLALHTQLAPLGSAWRYYLREPLFWGAILALGLAMLCWLVVLDSMPVSKAYPLLGANYIVMLAVARLGFGERVPLRRWLGATLIVGGLGLVSAS